jgi:hypothetical protein
MQRLMSQMPEQQSRPAPHAPPAIAQAAAAQVDAVSQPSEQQAPARAHGCPIDAQPTGVWQARAPVGPSAQMNEQQSPALAHG